MLRVTSQTAQRAVTTAPSAKEAGEVARQLRVEREKRIVIGYNRYGIIYDVDDIAKAAGSNKKMVYDTWHRVGLHTERRGDEWKTDVVQLLRVRYELEALDILIRRVSMRYKFREGTAKLAAEVYERMRMEQMNSIADAKYFLPAALYVASRKNCDSVPLLYVSQESGVDIHTINRLYRRALKQFNWKVGFISPYYYLGTDSKVRIDGFSVRTDDVRAMIDELSGTMPTSASPRTVYGIAVYLVCRRIGIPKNIEEIAELLGFVGKHGHVSPEIMKLIQSLQPRGSSAES